MPRAKRLLAPLCLCGVGCAAPLANPEAFEDRAPLTSSGGGGSVSVAGGGGAPLGGAPSGAGSAGVELGGSNHGGSTAGSGGAAVDGDLPACVTALFKPTSSGKCSNGVCHHGANAPGGLDLASPGVSARLVDQTASHLGANPSSGCPRGDKLIDSANPQDSWLLKKLTLDAAASCGAKMPATGFLTSDELSCLTGWVESF